MANEFDFTDSIHPAVAGYRKRLASQGLFDDQDDYQVVRFLAQTNPKLLEEDPSFGQLYGEIREANAPSLGEEFGRAAKRATIGLGATALGGGALLTGSDYLKRKARAVDLMASDPDLAPTIPTLEDIRPGQDGIGQAFSRDALRYGISKVGEVVPSAAEAAVTAGIGALAGSAAAPGPGTVAGAVGGLLSRGIIKRAIRRLVTDELGEEAIETALRQGVPEIVEAVTKNAANIAKVGGATAASAVNSYVLNAGEVYNENDDRGTAAVLGAVSAVPDTILPALLIRKLFPGVSLSAGRQAAKELVGSNAVKVAQAAGVTGLEAGTEAFQESVNIVARNLKDGRDPLSFDDSDLIRIREAGITGAVGGALASPAVVMGRDGEEISQAAPVASVVAPTVTPAAPVPVAEVTQLPTQRVRSMSPEQQVARLADLETRTRTADEEAEYQILKATVPTQAQTQITPEVVEAVQAGNLPLAPVELTPTNVSPDELGVLTPRAPPQTPDRQLTSQDIEIANRAEDQARQFAASRGMVGASIAPELELQEPADGAGSAPNLGSGVEVATAPALNVAQRVAEMDAPAFMAWSQQQQGGFTTAAHEAGIQAIGNPASIEALKAARNAAEQQYNAARERSKAGDVNALDDASSLAGKVQFFSEAIGAAENTGSAATAPEVQAAHAQLTPIPRAPEIQSPATLDVRNQPENGSPLGQGNAVVQEPAGTGATAQEEAPATLIPPLFEAQQETIRRASPLSDLPAEGPKRLWRETSAERAMDFIDPETSVDLSPDRPFFAADPSLALGQGGNKGVLIEFHPQFQVRASMKKPSDGFLHDQGKGEWVGEFNNQSAYQDAVQSFSFDKPLLNYKTGGVFGARLNLVIKGLKNKGWVVTEEAGRVKVSRGPADPLFIGYSETPSVAPLPRSAEQRLNDADIGLPPVSGMSRQAKRAELDAAGITEYAGKPLDDINPAQLSAAVGKLRRGELGKEPPPAPRTSTEPTNPAVNARRTQEFQAVMGRLVSNGANVQAMSQELLAQQTGEVLQQQIAALEQRLAQATTAPQRNELQKQIAVRQERLAEVQEMRGVTYSPYHIAIAMDDVMNASLDNLVTLIHEAAESLTMRLTPAQQGAVFRAVEKTTAQMQEKMQAAARTTGAVVANVPVPSELLAETLAQTLAAEGIQDAPSLSQSIVRWLKEIYYRVAMAAQRAFGGEPSPELALQWYENQLRRELGGDYQYSFGSLLNRLFPQSNAEYASKFSGASGTPGGMPDFFDPTTQKLQQPWVEPISDTALDWNMKFQTGGVNPGAEQDIPADEAVARQTAAAYNEQIKWLDKLRIGIAPSMDPVEFIGLVSRGEKTPHEMLDVLRTRFPGVETAEIGGDRMTDAMNKWAAHQTLEYMKGVQAKHLTRIAQMQESIKDADERFTEHARELNRLEPDVRNAELHEGELKKKARGIIDGLLKSYKNGIRTSSKLGMMIEAEENLGDRDPLPQFYTQAFEHLLNADVPIFDYAESIATLDLPLGDMTPEQIWKAIRDNADTSTRLRELSRNKPLAMTLSVLARDNARQFDQIMLRKTDAKTFLDIKAELDGIRNATEAQLREMLRTLDEKNDAKGLRQRIKAAYLRERRALNRASDRIALVEERMDVLTKAKPAVTEKLAEMQQAIGGVFSEWAPIDGAEFTVMRRNDAGEFQKEARTLQFNKDGSAVDGTGILNDLAQNEQWLKANVDRAGQKEYEQVKHQTRALQMLDVQRAYPAHNYGKIMGMIDAFVRPLQAIAKQAGHSVGNRIVQQFNKYEFINRSGAKALQNQSYEWGSTMQAAMKALGIEDIGQFRAQIYNPVKFWLGVNPGLDRPAAIRGAIKLAREQSPKTPAADFNEKFEAFLLKDKEIEDELLKTAEQNGVLVWDEKLGELRKAIARGWSTGMRMMNDGVVATLIHDMEKAGWKLEFDKDEAAKSKKVVTRSSTFDALNPANAKSAEERAEYYGQLDNTEALRGALKPYFTPGILERWLIPFINKPGESVFTHDGRDIPQIDLQNAWAKSGGDVLTWIDNLGQMQDVKPEDGASPAAYFRWDMLRQLEHLFKWEAGMAYEAEQTPDLFSNQGTKLHVMMDARVNDLLPAEHVNFAMHDPTSVRQMLGQIAFHGAFGRNGAGLMANLKELEAVSVAKKFAFDGLRSTTVEGRKREAKEKGFDYNDLKKAVDHYHDVLELKGEIESAMGVKNIYGPLYDARAGMEILGFMVGQVVDQPKTGALNFLSLGARPFAMHSFSPKVLQATAAAYAELSKNTFGGLLRDFGLDIIRMSDYAKETGEVEGKAFRRLPFGTVISGDPGKDGGFQDSLSSRFLVQPLRIFKALQKKGVGPGIAVIPGLGTMQRFSTEGAIANNRGQIFLLQEIINNGIRYFSAHPEDLNNPAFRFDANTLKLKADRGMYDWFRNKTVEYNMGTIERIVRDSIARQAAGERTITTEMVEQLAQMNAQELDGASSINTAPAGLAQNQALRVALPLLRWPLWMMHAAHEGLADANGRSDFKSMMRGIGRLAAWNLPLGLAFTFLIDEYDEKVLRKKNAMPAASKLAAIPVAGLPLALATTPREIPQELLAIGQRMIRAGNIYGLGGDLAGAFVAPFDPGSGQRAFSLDQRVLIMSQFLNLTQAISNMVSQGGTATWGSVYRPMVASVGGNGMLNSLDVVNNLLGLDNAEARLTTRINAARWVNTAAKELGIETKKASGFSSPTEMSVWTREMQLAAMANSRADFMEAYRKALDAARERVKEDDRIQPQDREKEAVARVLASWRARNPFSGLATTATSDQMRQMLGVMNEQGRRDVQDAMRYYDAYTQLIKPSELEKMIARRTRAVNPAQQMEALRRQAAGMMMAQ